MALLCWADLTATEQRLCEFAADGRLLDLSTGRDDEDDPARGEHWDAGRQVRAQLLHQLLSGRGDLKGTAPPLAVRVAGARVLGPLDVANLTLRCPLELRRCHLSGPIDLAKSKGPDLSLAASHLSAPLNGYRLRLDHDLDLRHCTCRGGIRLPGARIGGQIACAGAELSNDAGPALDAGRLTVDGGLFLRDGFTATGHGELGTIRLPGAHIGGQIACAGAQLSNDAGPALVLADTTLGSLHLAPDVGNDPQWSLSLSGATYQGIPTGASLDEWLTLLTDHTRGYTAQPWQQLAAVHRAVGHERDARRILIAQQDDGRRRLLRPPPGSRWPIRLQLWSYRSYLWLLRLVVGYGYQTWRALIALLLIVVAAGLGLLAGHVRISPTHVSPTQYVAGRTKATDTPHARCSPVEQIGLGVDLLSLPLIKANVRTRCDLDSATAVGQGITGVSWVLQILSWGAATLVVAGYTGVVRRT